MTIRITQEDIEHGRRCDPDCCPIGRALNRAGVKHLGVLGSGVMIMDPGHCTEVVPLPPEVCAWILAFDGQRPVEPISFEWTLPSATKAQDRPLRSERRAPLTATPELAAANG